MKKILFYFAILLIATISTNAQTEKGRTFISGSSELNFSNTTMTYEYDGEERGDSDVSQFNMTPTIGYFVADGFALGLSLNVDNSKQDDYTSNSVTFGPIAKYYFGTTNVKPFIQGGVYYGSQVEDNDTDESKAKASSWDIGGGVAIFLNNFASIDAALGYGQGTLTSKDDDKAKLKVSGIALNIGFSLYF